ncbi:MAG TPA: RsmD family RNA methyltransferase [Chitinophagaceae bacterium]|nr:RsmD family RNA methyltransferase [Chitinophagaceae bacterium]
MRIIGGKHGGRKFRPPSGIPARPTTDLAKEGLFNILSNHLDFRGLKTLDLFCGTGSISFELASRGAEDLILVDRDQASLEFIRKTAEELGFRGLKTVRADVLRYIARCQEQFGLIFAGPPYALPGIDRLPALIMAKPLLVEGGWLILEHTRGYDFSPVQGFAMARHYGTTIFSIFICSPEKPS